MPCDRIVMGWTLRITYPNRFHATASCDTFDKRCVFFTDSKRYHSIVTYTTLTRNKWFDTECGLNYTQFTQQLTMTTLFHINIIFLNTYWTTISEVLKSILMVSLHLSYLFTCTWLNRVKIWYFKDMSSNFRMKIGVLREMCTPNFKVNL